ncbi:MAG: transcriptional regulator [Pseudonocardiaceae bacterium]|nr:MAG: transcriptional regulator [Pseudonocardiaceae bacterium]
MDGTTTWADLDTANCSVARTAAIVGDAWTLVLLRDLFNGLRRFDDLATHLGVARTVLSRRLAGLVDAGLVEREPYREPGRRERHEYRLSAAGRDLLPVVLALMAWGDAHLTDDDGPPIVVEHRGCGAPVEVTLRCTDGHDVDPRRGTVARPGPGARLRTGTHDA